MLSVKISREGKKYTEYPPHQMIRLGRLETISLFQIPTSMSQFLAQGYCGVIVTLSLV